MKHYLFSSLFILLGMCLSIAGEAHSINIDSVAGIKMDYVYTWEDAARLAYSQKKPIFVNCYAKWAAPCQGMDILVFSDEEFGKHMSKNFVNLFMDMSSPEGKKFKDEYGIKYFAHYLVLDYKGNIIHRIQGGSKLPEFKQKVDMALNKSKSLAGTRAKYQSGKYSKKDLGNYLKALIVANEDSTSKKIGKEYLAMLNDEELPKSENWMLASINGKEKGRFYKVVVNNKPVFVENNGEKEVNAFLESIFGTEILGYALGKTEFDKESVEALHTEMLRSSLPDTCACELLYEIANFRGNRRYGELVNFLAENEKYFDSYKGVQDLIDTSFTIAEIMEGDKKDVISYLNARAEKQTAKRAAELKEFASQIDVSKVEGIIFQHSDLAEVQKMAKEQGKLIFLDCYTSWCGPCRMMSQKVFPMKKVGDYFNANFVNIKIDMEKGEGPELAKKYQVEAFPTMLILDAEGNLLKRIVGARSSEVLIEWASANS